MENLRLRIEVLAEREGIGAFAVGRARKRACKDAMRKNCRRFGSIKRAVEERDRRAIELRVEDDGFARRRGRRRRLGDDLRLRFLSDRFGFLSDRRGFRFGHRFGHRYWFWCRRRSYGCRRKRG